MTTWAWRIPDRRCPPTRLRGRTRWFRTWSRPRDPKHLTPPLAGPLRRMVCRMSRADGTPAREKFQFQARGSGLDRRDVRVDVGVLRNHNNPLISCFHHDES
jgi:hypothetical protein